MSFRPSNIPVFLFCAVAFLLFPGLMNAQTDCTSYSFSPASTNAAAGGGNFTVNITSTPASGCNRPAPVSDSSWIVPSTGGGTGGGILGFAVSATNSGRPRSGSISIGPSVFTVNQAAGNCTYSLSSTSLTISGAGGSNSFTVTPNYGDCAWSASSNASWITVTTPSPQSGPGAVGFTVDANPTTVARTATITAAGSTYTLTQSGGCQFTLTPASISMPYTGGTGNVSVAASVSSCAWVATTQASSWAQISFGTSGTGNGTVGYSISQNNSATPRNTTFTIGGAIFSIAQEGAPCNISVNPQSLTFPANGGPEQLVNITAASGCAWQAISTADWLTFSSGASGTGNGILNITASTNATGANRTGSITVGSAVISVTQTGCQISVSPSSLLNLPPAAITSGSIGVVAPQGCSWSGASGMTWLQVKSGASGNGNGTLTYAVDANNTGQLRSGQLTIAGIAIPVSQTSTSCQITASPSTFKFGVEGGNGAVRVTTSTTACQWSATSNADWISFASVGTITGSGAFAFTVLPNLTTSPRSGSISVAGTSVSITQDPQPPQVCTISVPSTPFNAPAAGGTGSFAVSALENCAWTVVVPSSTPWIALTSSDSGTGSGTVTFTVEANTTAVARSGVISVNGSAFFQIRQPGVTCSVAIDPKSSGFPANGGSGTVSVTSPCDWAATSKTDWIVLGAPSSGTGNGTLTYTIKPNTNTQPRSSSIAFSSVGAADVTMPVTQSSAACSYTLTPGTATMAGIGGTGSFKVASSSGCDWSPTSDSDWLKIVSFASVSGSGTVQYSVDFSAIGSQRTGTISLAGQTFTLTQDVGGPVVTTGGVMNAASFVAGPVAPGEIVSIFGQGLGPATPALLQLTDDKKSITTALGGTRVLFDGVAAPVTYASASQVNCIVPYGVDGKSSTDLKVEYQGVQSPQPTTMRVGVTSPAVFGSDATGGGQGAILNQDYKVNGASNAAARGSVIMIYATGEGQTKPAGVDGKLAAAPLPAPLGAVTVQIGGIDAKVNYAGAAPTLVSGVLQVNAVVPANAPIGSAVPLVIKVGGVPSQQGITVAIK